MKVRKARVGDAAAIHKLVNHYARKELMLTLSLGMVYDRLRDFSVCEEDGQVVACGSLHVVWEDLAEVRSLAVREDMQRRGIGRALFHDCLRQAPELGVRRVFALTFVPEFFRKMGMTDVPKETLPHKVWADCVRCHRFPNCDEVALIINVADALLSAPGSGPNAGGER